MAKYGDDLDFSMRNSMGKGAPKQDAVAAAAGPEAIRALTGAKMRCGGCGAKVCGDQLPRSSHAHLEVSTCLVVRNSYCTPAKLY